MKGAPSVRTYLQKAPATEVLLSPIVLGELELGVEKSAYPERNRARLQTVIDGFAVITLNAATSRAYGRIRYELERRGLPIGNNDLWIAAQALALGATLVTDNLREFERVPGLHIENWL